MKQQPNDEFEFLDSEEAINDSYNLKFVFYLALLEICEVGGLLFLQFQYNTLVQRYQIFEICLFIGIILFDILLIVWSKYLLNQFRSNENLQDPTNNFISRISLILLIPFSIFILYESLLFSYFENINIYNGPLRLAIILTQFAIFQCSSRLYKSPNVLRLVIYFQSLILTMLIIYSAIQIQELVSFNEQLQINKNLQIYLPILQIISLILLTINIGTNYVNNKRVISAFSSLFIIMAILYTVLGCYQFRMTENHLFSSDQAPLRGINQNNLVEFGCSQKYYQGDISQCPHIYKAEIWEDSNQTKKIGCLNQQCIKIADYYIRSKYFIIASNIIISSALLFIIGACMANIGIKIKSRKQLNPIIQYIIICIYFILLIIFSIIIYQSKDFWKNRFQNLVLQSKSDNSSQHLKFPLLEQLDQIKINDSKLSFIDLETMKQVVKGQFKYYNYQIDCNSVDQLSQNIPFYQTNIKDNILYNLMVGTEVTFIVDADQYFTKCANIFITNTNQIEIKLLRKNNYYLNVMLDSNTNSSILSNMNNNCQSGGQFTGCPQTISKNCIFPFIFFRKTSSVQNSTSRVSSHFYLRYLLIELNFKIKHLHNLLFR